MCLIVTINGSPSVGGRTGALLRETAAAVCRNVRGARVEEVSLAAEWREIFCGIWRQDISERGEELLRCAERADLLIVGSPIFRGTYTGVLKHYFDLVSREGMAGKNAIITATGGSALHGLALEHQFRPLMGFFGIQTTATALFGVEGDFEGTEIQSEALRERIERAAKEASQLLAAHRHDKAFLEIVR